MTKIKLPDSFNYIGAFLTYACNMKCDYCINTFHVKPRATPLKSSVMIKGLLRIQTRDDFPITLCGGEPTVHPDFYEIVNKLTNKGKHLDLLTNGMFNATLFCNSIKRGTFGRKAKYASIRISLHESTDLYKIVDTAIKLRENKHSVGIWGLDRQDLKEKNKQCNEICGRLGIDFRLKEFLGIYEEKFYGTYKYPDAIRCRGYNLVLCKPSEFLIAPDGYIYGCHSHLYSHTNYLYHILDDIFPPFGLFGQCTDYGTCNPCDIKVKFNRFQEKGHCAVTIEKVDEPNRKFGCKY